MNRFGVRGKWFVVLGVIFSLTMWWAPAGLADETKTENPAAKAEEAKSRKNPPGISRPTFSASTSGAALP